jgi:AcrR family transcriptional regulator
MDCMSTVPKQDRRIAKTRAALEGALVRLLETTSFAQISIAQIAEEADIARPTFYQHFDSTEALFSAVVDGVVEDVAARIPDEALEMPLDNVRVMRHILVAWGLHAQTLRVLVENGSRHILSERFERGVLEILTRTVKLNRLRKMRDRDAAYTASFLANAAIGVFSCWSRRDFAESASEIEGLVASLVGPGVEMLLRARDA